jgi:hypothetical protein
MNFDQLHSDGALKGLRVRASLHSTGEAAPSHSCPAWILVSKWVAAQEQPLLVSMRLRWVKLGGSECCVVHASAIAPSEQDAEAGADERALVYLLNPSDPTVWQAIKSWVDVGTIAARVNPRSGGSSSTVTPRDLGVLELKTLEGAELDSDMLAGEVLALLEAGQLEAELARQLGIKMPLHCAIVETPMMLKSLQPVDAGTLALYEEHKEHEMNRWLNDGIAS